LALLAVAALMTGPALLTPATAVPGHPQGDTYEHLHGFAWVARRIADGAVPWEAHDFGLPEGGVLWFPDLLGALLVLPLTWAAGAPLAYTVEVVAQVWFGLLGGYALGWTRGGTRGAGLLAAAIFGGSPLVMGLLHSGVSEYLHLVGFPVLWLASERALARGGRWIAAAALAWAWLGWANVYYVLFGAFVPILAASTTVVGRGPGEGVRAVRRYLATAGLTALLVLPVALAIGASLEAPGAMLREESAPGWSWVFLPANDLAGFVLPGDQLFPDLRDGGNFGIRHVAYLGAIAVLCALPAWRRWWKALLLAGLLAAGPSLHWRGQPVRVAGHFVPLPAAVLWLPGSPFRAVHHPYRLTVLPMLVLAAAAADALRRRERIALLAAGAVLAETLIVSPGAAPTPAASLVGAPELPEPGGVLDLPPDFRSDNRRWMGLQAVHGQPIAYTINVFLPAPFRSNRLYQASMGCLTQAGRHTIARDARPPLGVWLRKDSTQTLAEGVDEVRRWGFRYIALHGDVLATDERACLRALLEEGGGRRLRTSDAVEVYELGG
jgi:hypothetical protein